MTEPGERKASAAPAVPALDHGEGLPAIPDVTLHGEIARGGMGVVYRGRQAFLDRDVAVKLLAERLQGEPFAARFRREARILAGIKHPNIVACHTAGTTAAGQSYLVMEFVDGPNLKTWIAEHGALAVPAALRLVRQLASALGHAADLGVIHRDVKPENVLLEAPTSTAIDLAFPHVPKLVDLGLARMTHETGAAGLTSPGAVMGTLGTMAPEQLDAPDSVDFRADIYGLGCVLYHMLTGGPAFSSLKLTDVVAEKQRAGGLDPCSRFPAIPAAVGRLVADMLAPDRDQRPASYRELTARLDDLIAAQARIAQQAGPAVKGRESPLLQTAEIRFLAGSGPTGQQPVHEAATFPPPTGILPRQASLAPAAPPATIGPARAAPARRGRPMLILGAVAAVMVLVAVPMLKGQPGEVPPSADAPRRSVPAPTAPVSLRSVAIQGLDGPVRPSVPLELTSESVPASASGLNYRWAVRPEASATLGSPTAASTRLQLSGLPGDEFTVELEASAGGASVQAQRRIVLDYPATDLLPDFLDQSTEWLARTRLHGEWLRRKEDGAIVCTAPDAPCVRTHTVPGTTWRLQGLLLPERMNRRGFAQTAFCLKFGPVRQLAVVCEREGLQGENWTVSLQEVEREEARGTFAFHPLPQPKVVTIVDRVGKLVGASYTITRRGSDIDFRLGFPGSPECAEHREHVRINPDVMAFTLCVRGGRGVFPKLELW